MSALSEAIVARVIAKGDETNKSVADVLKSEAVTSMEDARRAQFETVKMIGKELGEAKVNGSPDSYINALERLFPESRL